MNLKLNFEYDKLKLKQIIILIPNNHTNLNSLLTPILGLYGLDVKNFITTFEKLTSYVATELIIPVEVVITKIKTFNLRILPPYTGNLLAFYNSVSNKLDYNILLIYKFSLLKSVILSFFKPSLLLYKNIRNYLLNYNSKNKNNLKKINFSVFQNFDYCKYGLIFNFVNANNNYFNELKNLATLFNLNIRKINNFLVSDSCLKLTANNYIIGANDKNVFLQFFRTVNFSSTVGFLPLFVKFNNNLINIDFFNKFAQQLKENNKCSLLKTIFYMTTVKRHKIIKNQNTNLLKLYAYIPTTNKTHSFQKITH